MSPTKSIPLLFHCFSCEEEGVAIHWKIVNNDYIELAVAARATGWLAFGLGEAGGMDGADMVIYEESNPKSLMDAYNLEVNVNH